MFLKTGVITNFAIFTRKKLSWSLFLIKLQALRAATLFQPRLKRDSTQVIPVKITIFLPTAFFCGTPPVTAFVSLIK